MMLAGLRSRFREFLGDETGQMTVELCVVFPVAIAIAAIVFNAMVFFGDCATFDRASRNAIRLSATSIPVDSSISQISSEVAGYVMDQMETDSIDCECEGSIKGEGYMSLTLTYRYIPTLFGMDLRSDVFGISFPTIDHSIKLTVDPYTPGKWIWTYMY